MTNTPELPKQKQNQYILAGAGAVLGGLVGAGVAGVLTAVLGAVVGGLAGYHLLTRFKLK
ncbi:MAG TPA: hypothetical protein VK446_03285 [Methylocystis sp.]|nr:hypothetical protein [Methylocystis sp.]